MKSDGCCSVTCQNFLSPKLHFQFFNLVCRKSSSLSTSSSIKGEPIEDDCGLVTDRFDITLFDAEMTAESNGAWMGCDARERGIQSRSRPVAETCSSRTEYEVDPSFTWDESECARSGTLAGWKAYSGCAADYRTQLQDLADTDVLTEE